MRQQIETIFDWLFDRWLFVLSIAAVIFGLLFGRRAERKAEAGAIKIVKATETAKRANKHHETANEILQRAKQETKDHEKGKPLEVSDKNEFFPPPTSRELLRDRVRDINRRLRSPPE